MNGFDPMDAADAKLSVGAAGTVLAVVPERAGRLGTEDVAKCSQERARSMASSSVAGLESST